MMNNKKVIIGMSGGVDSSVAAALLKEQGFEVIGVTMRLYDNDCVGSQFQDTSCCSLSSVEDARRVSDKIGIPYYVMDFRKDFEKYVMDYFFDEYKNARTPNPCIACNKFVKFKALIDKAKALGADYVATGHYAKVEYDGGVNRFLLKKSATEQKDQTYVLYNLTQNQLKHILMPLGGYTKDEVRCIAQKLDLTVAKKPDSQEICFVPDKDYAGFIQRKYGFSSPEGNFVDMDGNVLGRHKGIIHYTIGQRKGFGIAFNKPMYVVKINHVTNDVVLGEQGDEFGASLIADNLNFIPFGSLSEPMEVTAKIRYSAKVCAAYVIPLDGGKVKVEFGEPVRAITPGQSVVFYSGDIVVGGGVIK